MLFRSAPSDLKSTPRINTYQSPVSIIVVVNMPVDPVSDWTGNVIGGLRRVVCMGSVVDARRTVVIMDWSLAVIPTLMMSRMTVMLADLIAGDRPQRTSHQSTVASADAVSHSRPDASAK